METADHPGLLVDLVKTITDINVAVESGEFDTEVLPLSSHAALIFSTTPSVNFSTLIFCLMMQGLLAKAKFHVSYRGKALIKPLQQVNFVSTLSIYFTIYAVISF